MRILISLLFILVSLAGMYYKVNFDLSPSGMNIILVVMLITSVMTMFGILWKTISGGFGWGVTVGLLLFYLTAIASATFLFSPGKIQSGAGMSYASELVSAPVAFILTGSLVLAVIMAIFWGFYRMIFKKGG